MLLRKVIKAKEDQDNKENITLEMLILTLASTIMSLMSMINQEYPKSSPLMMELMPYKLHKNIV
jgi:hypothetical protein